ncbi:hypothetical protein NA56DRAFT_703411 [Hyaloscypha hepaticicola]|uniref:Uncharacterized protein n=1 Tax=Hyaloscypha hepaticicola TaxID=2082293 RepID=A0A2J6Q6D1_9HELO|nr:hypothetical protein NA56DRAFT_703411 [Hyaloscypha hepaticicola]
MARHLYLLVFPTRASKINGTRSHWAIFIPDIVDTSIGKLIQVLGTPFTGYGLKFRRNYNISTIAETFEQVLLGEVDEKWTEKAEEKRKMSTDVNPRDEVERLAKRVEVPGVSREPLNPLVGRRCQEWTRDFVDLLIGKGILDGSAIGVLDRVKDAEGKQL